MRWTLILIAAGLWGQSRGAKPDLHGGGAKPSLIPNHQTTTVTLPGFHFSGAQVTLRGPCRLAGYRVVSDDEIRMDIEGKRTIEDTEDGCFFTVKTAAGSSTSYVVVGLTADEEKDKEKRKQDAGRAKFEAMVRAAGRKWVVRFSDGVERTYTVRPSEGAGEPPQFESADGSAVKIVVDPNGTAFLIEGRCIRSGRLENGRVLKGDSMAGCEHPGTWSATVE